MLRVFFGRNLFCQNDFISNFHKQHRNFHLHKTQSMIPSWGTVRWLFHPRVSYDFPTWNDLLIRKEFQICVKILNKMPHKYEGKLVLTNSPLPKVLPWYSHSAPGDSWASGWGDGIWFTNHSFRIIDPLHRHSKRFLYPRVHLIPPHLIWLPKLQAFHILSC